VLAHGRGVDPRFLASVLNPTRERPREDFEVLLGVQGLDPNRLRALVTVAALKRPSRLAS
jgi:hypothetical protein